MAASAVMLKTASDSIAQPLVARPTPRAVKTAPAARRPRRMKGDDRLSLIALAPKAGEIILDLGCGPGRRFSHFLQTRSIAIGIDSSFSTLRSAQRKFSETSFVHSQDWEALPFVNGHFDAILCTLAGEHLDHMHAVLRELHRILKPGGRIVLALHYPEIAQNSAQQVDGRIQANLFEVDLALRTGAFRHTAQDYLLALQAAGCVDIRQHNTQVHGRQQSLFPEEDLHSEREEFPALVVLQALRAK